MTMRVEKVGIAGVGALGNIVAKALLDGMPGYELAAISTLDPVPFDVPTVPFAELADRCDLVVECLPAAAVPALAEEVLGRDKTLVLISSCALVLYPEIRAAGRGRILVPSGALAGLDAVTALAMGGISNAKVVSSKPPQGFRNNRYVVDMGIELSSLQERVMIFVGSVNEAARQFPANINVAATLAIAGIGPERTEVEIWADPGASANSHEIFVEGRSGVVRSRIENVPDPSNPKSSIQAAYSILSLLEKRTARITHF